MDTINLIKQAHMGDKNSRDQILIENTPLIWSIVKRFLGRGYEGEDLFQIGCIGMLKAIDRFDLSLNLSFSTYAVPLITGEIRRFLRDDGIIKISRTIKENQNKIMLEKGQIEEKEIPRSMAVRLPVSMISLSNCFFTLATTIYKIKNIKYD